MCLKNSAKATTISRWLLCGASAFGHSHYLWQGSPVTTSSPNNIVFCCGQLNDILSCGHHAEQPSLLGHGSQQLFCEQLKTKCTKIELNNVGSDAGWRRTCANAAWRSASIFQCSASFSADSRCSIACRHVDLYSLSWCMDWHLITTFRHQLQRWNAMANAWQGAHQQYSRSMCTVGDGVHALLLCSPSMVSSC